jgi:hypothetical protein
MWTGIKNMQGDVDDWVDTRLMDEGDDAVEVLSNEQKSGTCNPATQRNNYVTLRIIMAKLKRKSN